MEHSQPSDSKTLGKLTKSRSKFGTSFLILILGILLILFGGIKYANSRNLSFSRAPVEAVRNTQDVDVPVEILIPSLKIAIPVETGLITNGDWQISDKSATFLNTSAAPGTMGNTVIYGHNKKVIFGNIPYLSIGQKIVVKTKSGKLYNYVADQKYFVGPDRVDLVSPTTTEELTIYTCWGLFDSQRAVIKAKPAF